MADYDSSLPVRTENAGDVAAKIVDGATPSQALSVDASGAIKAKLLDGSGTAVTSQANGSQQALDVGINVAGVQIDPRQIRALTGSDVVTANQGTAAAISGAWPVLPTDGTNSQSFTAAGEAKVQVTQPLPAGTNNIGKVSIQDSSGAAISDANPLPVYVTADAPGDEINAFNTAAAVAANASSNHDYTVTSGKTLKLTQIEASGSGKLKIEVQVETGVGTNVFLSKFVQFNSTANPNLSVSLREPISVAAGVRVRVIRTNRDNQSQDVYSTISGHEI